VILAEKNIKDFSSKEKCNINTPSLHQNGNLPQSYVEHYHYQLPWDPLPTFLTCQFSLYEDSLHKSAMKRNSLWH
jgi:hypothetical protein